MNSSQNFKKTFSGPGSPTMPEQMETEDSVVREATSCATNPESEMELEETFNLDSESLNGGPSATSLILESPKRKEEGRTDNLPGPVTRTNDEGQPESNVTVVKRLSNAQKRRLNWYIRNGYASEEARTLALHPIDQRDRHNPAQTKRQRSMDTVSPNTSAKGPKRKKPRARDNERPAVHQPQAGTSYREMAEAIILAITSSDYPSSLLTTDQLTAVRAAILDRIADQDAAAIRPKFRNCVFKNGYLTLACADEETVTWLETTVPTLKPWEGALLGTYHMKDLPKALLFMGYFQDSVDTPSERIVRYLQNQNNGFSTEAWRVRHRKTIGNTVELLLEVDQASAKQLSEQRFLLNYMFSKARMRQVGKNSVNIRLGNSAARSGKVRAAHPSGEATPPPGPSTSATVGTVLHQPPPGRKSQNLPKNAGRVSVSRRLRRPKPYGEDNLPLTSASAAGSRPPVSGSTDPTKDGTSEFPSQISASAVGNRLPVSGSIDPTNDGGSNSSTQTSVSAAGSRPPVSSRSTDLKKDGKAIRRT